MYRWMLSVLCAIAAASVQAQTPVSGEQTGTWSLAESPYHLVGDVFVPEGDSLTIEPGVEVVGMGHYSITVEASAVLTAAGTPELPILFTSADQTAGWRGLKLDGSSGASVIRHCVFEYAKADGLAYPHVRGGALRIINCSPEVSFSEFRFNVSQNTNFNGTGGGIFLENSHAILFKNFIHNNTADSGAGICVLGNGSPEIRHNRLADNSANYAGGGLYLGTGSTPIVHGNTIVGNFSAGWGGGGINIWGAYRTDVPTMVYNNIIAGNSTSAAGGGIYCRYDRSVLANNLLGFNQAFRGGGLFVLNQGGSVPRLENSIVWGNTANTQPQLGFEDSTNSELTVRYSNIAGGYPGPGNIDADPLFVEPESGVYRLLPGSPCIDAGDNDGVPAGVAVDHDGNARFIDDPATEDTGNGTAPIVDIGPYEYQLCPADFNGDGAVNTIDVIVFLGAWAAGDTSADFNGDGEINTLDVLAFLEAWSAGC